MNNELFLYAEVLLNKTGIVDPNLEEGTLLSNDGSSTDYTFEKFVNNFNHIYLDFNGSMAFLKPRWCSLIDDICKQNKVKGAFIQGGIYTFTKPKTIPARDKILNRLSCATMNQLYSPVRAGLFFQLMKKNGILMYVVANNDVEIMTNYKTFLEQNGIGSETMQKYSQIFYTSRESVRVKPYDFYVALIVSSMMKDNDALFAKSKPQKLFYNSEYAAILLTDAGNDDLDAVIDLIKHKDTILRFGDSETISTDKRTFQREFETLLSIHLSAYDVRTLSFKMDQDTMKLTTEPSSP